MHRYGFVLPGGWTWEPYRQKTGTIPEAESLEVVEVDEAWHRLTCHCTVVGTGGMQDCLTIWRFPDAELAHVNCLDLMNVARDHERRLHAGATAHGMRVPPTGLNCLGGELLLPVRHIGDITLLTESPKVVLPLADRLPAGWLAPINSPASAVPPITSTEQP